MPRYHCYSVCAALLCFSALLNATTMICSVRYVDGTTSETCDGPFVGAAITGWGTNHLSGSAWAIPDPSIAAESIWLEVWSSTVVGDTLTTAATATGDGYAYAYVPNLLSPGGDWPMVSSAAFGISTADYPLGEFLKFHLEATHGSAQFDAWMMDFPFTELPIGVPEPTTFTFLAIGLLCLSLRTIYSARSQFQDHQEVLISPTALFPQTRFQPPPTRSTDARSSPTSRRSRNP